jgi:serine/threonine-protein phosphatase 2A regulatory subunit B'
VLKFWPQTTSKKELMYLNEVEEILDRVQATHLGPALVPLFKQVAKAINSPHFQVDYLCCCH